jgi:outer membrane protein TolC
VAAGGDRCDDAAMSEIQYVNTLAVAQRNLDEAERQVKEAQKAFKAGDISEDRLRQLEGLHELAAADLERVRREN